MIKLTETCGVTFNSGYYIAHRVAVYPAGTAKAGEEYNRNTFTYAHLSGLVTRLEKMGVNVEDVEKLGKDMILEDGINSAKLRAKGFGGSGDE
jgi:hypothetical protein